MSPFYPGATILGGDTRRRPPTAVIGRQRSCFPFFSPTSAFAPYSRRVYRQRPPKLLIRNKTTRTSDKDWFLGSRNLGKTSWLAFLLSKGEFSLSTRRQLAGGGAPISQTDSSCR